MSVSPIVAMSSKDYLITAGDVYTLAFAQGTTPMTYSIPVDTSYKIRVGNLAILNVRGKTYSEVKTQVEQIVTKNLPMSGVQFVLTTPGLFYVRVQGEVPDTTEVRAWGLTRLSEVVKQNMTPYSSTRDVKITNDLGTTKTYDLFKALRNADMSQNPHLRPGDVVTINRYSRKVSISGAVERGSTSGMTALDSGSTSGMTALDSGYELLEGENMKELISIYANGYTDDADRNFAEVQRLKAGTDESEGQYETIYLYSRAEIENFELMNNDSVTIHSITEQRPVVFIEGAIYGVDTEMTTTGLVQPSNSNIVTAQFSPGENYTYFIRNRSRMFADIADLEKVYIEREGKIIPIDAYKIIYDYTYSVEENLQSNDRLVVPFRQYFVSVAGAVVNPGRYPYLPDRTWDYYIGLAGGFIPNRNKREKVSIIDMYGKKHNKKDPITPETTITAASNSFTYFFSNYSSVISTLLTATSLIITVLIAADKI